MSVWNILQLLLHLGQSRTAISLRERRCLFLNIISWGSLLTSVVASAYLIVWAPRTYCHNGGLVSTACLCHSSLADWCSYLLPLGIVA